MGNKMNFGIFAVLVLSVFSMDLNQASRGMQHARWCKALGENLDADPSVAAALKLRRYCPRMAAMKLGPMEGLRFLATIFIEEEISIFFSKILKKKLDLSTFFS